MGSKEDLQFLALLVHRGHLERADAEPLLASLKDGAELDELLVKRLGWEAARVAKMRRTRAGEEPEVPGFEFLGRLGVGGTADVFRVREKKTGRSLALKILNPSSTKHAPTLKAFVTEARLLESLDHPNLVRGYGVAKSGGSYFTRLELVEGQTLQELLDEGRSFEEGIALRILLEVAEALQYMASEDLVHRDIKAGNIMLDQNGAVKLIDLGFCATTSEKSAADSTVGTVQYLSPEQARGGANADFRSDIYSLGVTLFQLLVGRLPFESSDDREVLRMQVMDSLSSPELKGRGFSPHVQYFIEKMMAKDLDLRYQSWDEMIADIREQLEGRDSLDYSRGKSSNRPRSSRRGSSRRR